MFSQLKKNARDFEQSGSAPIPGLTAARGMGADIPGFSPMGFGPQQAQPFMPGGIGDMSSLTNRIYGQQPAPMVPQGLMELLASNPNVSRFLGRGV